MSYREPADVRRATEFERPAGPRHAAAIGSLAALAGASALVAGQPELWAAFGVGALAAAARAWSARIGLRRADALVAFFECDEVEVGPGVWTSPDGRRRVRSELDGLLRFERLEPSTGETLASFRVRAPFGPDLVETAIFERRVAPVHGRSRGARCFTGLPPELGDGAVPDADPSHLLLEARQEGVLLVRCDAAGRRVGDTLHPDLASALRQLEAEHGEHVGDFRVVERDPIASGHHARSVWDGLCGRRLAL